MKSIEKELEAKIEEIKEMVASVDGQLFAIALVPIDDEQSALIGGRRGTTAGTVEMLAQLAARQEDVNEILKAAIILSKLHRSDKSKKHADA